MLNKRKYTSITFAKNIARPLKYRMVKGDFKSYYYWLQRQGIEWTAINVYDRQTKQFVLQLTPSNYWYKLEKL